jgi:hypothetical protein
VTSVAAGSRLLAWSKRATREERHPCGYLGVLVFAWPTCIWMLSNCFVDHFQLAISLKQTTERRMNRLDGQPLMEIRLFGFPFNALIPIKYDGRQGLPSWPSHLIGDRESEHSATIRLNYHLLASRFHARNAWDMRFLCWLEAIKKLDSHALVSLAGLISVGSDWLSFNANKAETG